MSSVRCASGTCRDISQWCWSPGAVVPAISLHSGGFSAELSHRRGREEVHTMRLIWFGVLLSVGDGMPERKEGEDKG